jgi:cyclopropane-fatty-acyl-phospholipid synthase
LSQQQLDFARDTLKRQKLEQRVCVDLRDYREAGGSYEKIVSVGMFEHVGYRGLPDYFKKVYSLLTPRGLFLNRGVIRPQGVSDGAETLFLQKHVFPGGELVHLDDVIREGERAGLHAIGLRDLRSHYALTCRRWVENLQRNAAHCRVLVGQAAYRTWLLYLAASAVSFEDGRTGAAQVLFEKR